tara:strand:- start:10 stop:294 length:285 start_codon:yes stop_codon:yes gene_type:complete
MALKLEINVAIGVVYIAAKNVPPITIKIDGISTNGDKPPPTIMAPAIIAAVPISPIREAISMAASPVMMIQIINARKVPIDAKRAPKYYIKEAT